MSIELHDITWTPAKVERLWNYYGSNPAYKNAYFAKHSGHRILAEVTELVGVTGDILDVGCGPGHLLEHIKELPSWKSYTGVDTSASSLAEVARQATGVSRRITALPVADVGQLNNASMDRVFCVEVVEHCDDATLREIFALNHRVLRSNGYVIVTTPNTEDLERSLQVCPDCGCVYHKWQHIRSWNCSSISDFVMSCGFDVHSVFTCHFGCVDLGRGLIDRFAAQLRLGKRWRTAFLHLPHIMLVATPRR